MNGTNQISTNNNLSEFSMLKGTLENTDDNNFGKPIAVATGKSLEALKKKNAVFSAPALELINLSNLQAPAINPEVQQVQGIPVMPLMSSENDISVMSEAPNASGTPSISTTLSQEPYQAPFVSNNAMQMTDAMQENKEPSTTSSINNTNMLVNNSPLTGMPPNPMIENIELENSTLPQNQVLEDPLVGNSLTEVPSNLSTVGVQQQASNNITSNAENVMNAETELNQIKEEFIKTINAAFEKAISEISKYKEQKEKEEFAINEAIQSGSQKINEAAQINTQMPNMTVPQIQPNANNYYQNTNSNTPYIPGL